jgi:hypothetical protein
VSAANLTIDRRYCGPHDSANGGYTAGRLAALLDAPAEVTLRRPPPLDTPMPIETDGCRLLLTHEGAIVAEAVPTTVNLALPTPPTLEAARAASAAHPNVDRHPFPNCFVCGPQRTSDGLGLHPGALPEGVGWAAVWASPASDTDNPNDVLAWAAMDCPAGWAVNATDPDGVHVLGRMTGTVLRPLPSGPVISLGWCISRHERKATAGSTLFDPNGSVLAYSTHTWIRLRRTDTSRRDDHDQEPPHTSTRAVLLDDPTQEHQT